MAVFTVDLKTNVFAVYTGLIASGYDLLEISAENPVSQVVEDIRKVPWPEKVLTYFKMARKRDAGVNPYWPRAAMLLIASFYVGETGRNPCMTRSLWSRKLAEHIHTLPISPRDKSSDILKWLEGFPGTYALIFDEPAFDGLWRSYKKAMETKLPVFADVTEKTISSFLRLTGASENDLPAVCVVPNPLQAPQVADFVTVDGIVYMIIADPRPASIIHELLHNVFEPGLRSAKTTILQYRHLLMPVLGKMIRMQYAWDDGPDSWYRVFEENFMRAASIWVERGGDEERAQADAEFCAQEGFIYVPSILRLLLTKWMGLRSIGFFIKKSLQECEKLLETTGL